MNWISFSGSCFFRLSFSLSSFPQLWDGFMRSVLMNLNRNYDFIYLFFSPNDGSFGTFSPDSHRHLTPIAIGKLPTHDSALNCMSFIALFSPCLCRSIFIASICMKFVTCERRGSEKCPLSCGRFIGKFYFILLPEHIMMKNENQYSLR